MSSISSTSETALSERLLLRLSVEDFLYAEAALLDAWKLDEWLALFTDDATYVVPPTDLRDGDPRSTLTLIDDDHLRLTWRVNRLKSRHAHREYPYSRTRRLITNVRVLDVRGDEVDIEAAIEVHRMRHEKDDSFVGRYLDTLVRTDDGFRIRRRRAELDIERLTPNGALSVVF